MIRPFLILTIVCASLFAQTALAQPQKEPKPTMTLIISSNKKVLDDFRLVMVDLAASKDEFETLSDAINVLIDGLDDKKPISWRNYLIGKEARDLHSASVAGGTGFQAFLTSLRDLGYTTRRELSATGLYRMGGEDNGSVYYNAANNLLHIAPIGKKKDVEAQKASHKFAMLIKSPPPADLLKGKDVVFWLENDKAQTADRKAAWGTMISSIVKAIETKNEKESVAQHDLRVAAGKQQLEELERFFVEAATVRMDWALSTKSRSARAELDLSLLPGTDLAKGMDELAKASDDFSDVSIKDAVVRLNVTFPLDEMRKRHVHDLAKTWMPAMSEAIDKNADLTAEQKKTSKALGNVGTEIVHGVADLGMFNGFVRLYTNPIGYTTLGAVKLADSSKIIPQLKKLEGHKGVTVTIDAHKEGDLSIHAVTLETAAKRSPKFFDKAGTVYLATGPNVLWYALGEGSLDTLKKAYNAAKTTGPKTGSPIVDGHMALAPWAEFVDAQRGTGGDAAVRKSVIEALKKGKDTITMKLEKVDDSVKGFMIFDEGVLRAAGKLVAKIVKETIE